MTKKNEIFDGSRGVAGSTYVDGGSSDPLGWFKTEVVDVPLPSMGLVYAPGTPLAGKESIVVAAMTAAQENILTNRSLAKRGTLLSHLLQSCIKDKNINARDMLVGDRSSVMVGLRISSYGAEYRASVDCPACDEKSEQVFHLDKLPLRRLAIQPIEKGVNLFEFVLPQSRARVNFRFLTGADEEDIAIAQAQKKKVIQGASDNDVITSSLQYMIVSINGVTDRAQLNAAIPRMPAFDSQALRGYILDNEPGIQLRAPMVCPACDHYEEVDMPLGASFFWSHAKR